jgi:DNA-binding winged helix-turn-helix (wHTH) protein
LIPPSNRESQIACSFLTKTIEASSPFLEVQEPDGQEYNICLQNILEHNPEQTRITIGRNSDNDIVLADPYKKIGRHHCVLEREGDRWWLVDKNSANGTYLRQEGSSGSEVDVRDVGTILLHDGDQISILGKLTISEQPVFWQLKFCDPNATDYAKGFQAVEMEYHVSLQSLWQVSKQGRVKIKLSSQEQRLIHYMVKQNLENNNEPAVCKYKHLIEAIWLEPFNRSSQDINHLVFSLRAKIERDSSEPQFLKTWPKQGYLLDIKIK